MSVGEGGLLLSLVRSLQVDLFVHWLKMADIGRLDSAFSSKTHRASFLEILREDFCIFEEGPCFSHQRCLSWVLKRSVKMTHAAIQSDWTPEEQLQYFVLNGKHITHLRNENITGEDSERKQRCRILKALLHNIASMCPKLQELQLEDSNFYGNSIDPILMKCPHLTRLDLNHSCNVSFRLLAGLWNIPNIVSYLDLSECTYDPSSTQCVLKENKTLLTLYAPTEGEDPQYILPFVLKCKALRVLAIDGLTFADVLAVLTHCPTLTALSVGLDLDADDQISDEEIAALLPLVQNLSVLHIFDLEYQLELDESLVLTIVQNCPNLRALYTEQVLHRESALAYVPVERTIGNGGTCTGSPALVNSNSHRVHLLQTLRVDTLSPTTLNTIVSLCPHLSSLSLDEGNLYETEDTAEAFFQAIGQAKIQGLNLGGGCNMVTSAHLLHLCNLTRLTLKGVAQLTDFDVVGIVDRSPMLTSLHLVDCPNLTRVALLYILEHCVHLAELTYEVDTPWCCFHQRGKSEDREFMRELACKYRPSLQKDKVKIAL